MRDDGCVRLGTGLKTYLLDRPRSLREVRRGLDFSRSAAMPGAGRVPGIAWALQSLKPTEAGAVSS